jgi:hypothetical protein
MRILHPVLALALAALGGAVVAAPPRRIIVYPYHVTVEGAGAARFQGMQRGRPARVRGRSGEAYVPVTLVRGVSEDPGFAGWVGVVQKRGAPRMKHRSSVAIVTRGPRGGAGTTTSLRACWVADYRATPERARHGMTIERLGLRCAPGAGR